MDKNKLHFIEEAKIKRELEKVVQEVPLGQTNPIKTNLMKFVNFKQKNKFTPKDLF